MVVRILQVDAFATKLFGGNPAAIVPDAKGISEDKMQLIAREMNVSETAFIEKLEKGLFEVRFFTPKNQVDLCGHATIGGFYIMALEGYIDPIDNGIKVVRQKTKAGILPVFIEYKDGQVTNVFMEQSKPKSYGKIQNLEEISKALSIDIEDIGIEGMDIMPEIISTGLKDILLPVKSKEILDGIKVDEDLLSKISEEKGVIGLHAFYMPDVDGNQVYTRNFAPYVGIPEESATGTSNGALIHLLIKENILKGDSLMAYQGELLGRPSKISCLVDKDVVKVGGKAIKVLDGKLNIL